MQLAEIKQRYITVQLRPEDAYLLAVACSTASAALVGSAPAWDERLQVGVQGWAPLPAARWLETTGELLQAAALAATAQGEGSRVTLSGLREGGLLDPDGAGKIDAEAIGVD